MGKIKSGLSKQAEENLLADAEAFSRNFSVGVDTYKNTKEAGKLISATQGGGEFKTVATIGQIEVDGVAGKVKGLELIDSWEVS